MSTVQTGRTTLLGRETPLKVYDNLNIIIRSANTSPGQKTQQSRHLSLVNSFLTVNLQSHLKETKTKNLVNTIKNESSPHIRQNISVRTACLELLPFILEVITPTLRPVSMIT